MTDAGLVTGTLKSDTREHEICYLESNKKQQTLSMNP